MQSEQRGLDVGVVVILIVVVSSTGRLGRNRRVSNVTGTERPREALVRGALDVASIVGVSFYSKGISFCIKFVVSVGRDFFL